MKSIQLNDQPMFLQIGISRMGDKRGVSSDEIEVDADKDLVKVRKIIFKSPSFDKIKRLDSEIRRYVRSVCFPYESGLHLFPQKMVEIVNARLELFSEQRFGYICIFAREFENLKQEFPAKLRKLYNEKDYETGDIASQFSMWWQILKIEVPPDLDKISSAMASEERKKLQARMQEAYEEARMILRETLLDLVTHLRDSLESDHYGAPKRLATTTVTKLHEFLNQFNLRDITNDTELGELVNQIQALTHGVDAESLRTLDGLRLRVRSELQAAEEKLTEAVIVPPTRRIKVG
jgi:hypothetical protein